MKNSLKMIKTVLKIFLGIIVFYLAVCLVILPIAGPFIAKSQAKKIIGQNLNTGLMIFNPFTWKLSINNLRLSDQQDELLLGFDKFWVDVSFLSLLKKKYHVQSLGITGMKVNAVMDAEGNINLLALVPEKETSEQQEAPAEEIKTAEPAPAEQESPAAAEPKELPDIAVDLFSFENGEFVFRDKSVDPNFLTSLNNINLTITNLSTDPQQNAKISLQALLDNKAQIINEASLNPFKKPLSMEMVFKLNNYVMDVLTPYVGKYTGREAKSGKMDIKVEYRIVDDKLDAKHKVNIQSFDFGNKVESEDALNLPFSMALTLLEDPQDRININLPVSGDIKDPEFHYFQMIGQVARNFFMKIVTKPFTALVSMVGSGSSSEEYGYIGFAPGSAELTDKEKEKIKTIIDAFNQRPNIGIKIKKCYDSVADWRQIKTDVFEQDFQKLKSETERSDEYVYERLFDRRFGMRAFWDLTNKYKLKGGGYDFEKIRAEVRRLMIEDGSPDKQALEKIAQQRAEAIYDFMISQGFDAERLSLDDFEQNQILGEVVPVTLDLKIKDDAQEEQS
jgi:outer membrane protein OmpA-like peptidoglycan-associated protein